MNDFIKKCIKNICIALVAAIAITATAVLTAFLTKMCTNPKMKLIIVVLILSLFCGIFVTILDFYSNK